MSCLWKGTDMADSWTESTLPLLRRGLGSDPATLLSSLSPEQDRAILIAGVTCASISLVAVLCTLRWFVLMQRSFRHRLIMFLIMSDSFKAFMYFLYPVVDFGRTITSSSNFCQASGFLLALATEASDFAILMISLHVALYIFRPPCKPGEGGLHEYRRYIYVLWAVLPTLAASLAFTNPGNAYVSNGTFCYLPKRPFWYRLALAWIPRYLIFITILSMYVAIYVYVRIKFKGFGNFANDDTLNGSSHASARPSIVSANLHDEWSIPPELDIRGSRLSQVQQQDSRSSSVVQANKNTPQFQQAMRWEEIDFITTQPLDDTDKAAHGIASADFAPASGSSTHETQDNTRKPSCESLGNTCQPDRRKDSDAPILENEAAHESYRASSSAVNCVPLYLLENTRLAIRRQLRFMFVYPAAYMLLWIFPFVSHCLLYSDYYTLHTPFWLSIITNCCLALQAGVDCAVFSCTERPWRRIDTQRAGSIQSIDRTCRRLLRLPEREENSAPTPFPTSTETPKREKTSTFWWEAEGKKRKDSVWMGTDILRQIITRKPKEEEEEKDEKSVQPAAV